VQFSKTTTQILFLQQLTILMQEEIDKWKRTEYMLKSIKFPRIRWTTFVHWNGPTANCSGHL